MKILGLMRHAKSSYPDGIKDHERPLSRRGQEAADAMLPVLAAEHFDLVLASTATRVRETVERAGLRDIGWRDGIYGASPAEIMAMIATVSDDVDRLLVVGHNPTMHLLADRLSRDDRSDERRHLAKKFPTGALAVIGLGINRWDESARATGLLERFVRPRDL